MLIEPFKSFAPAYKLILKDKTSLLLAMTPVLIGILLYFFAGRFFFSTTLDYGNQLIAQYTTNETVGSVTGIIVGSVLSIFFFFVINWTFVMVLAVLASPFNQVLSARIEKLHLGENTLNFQETMQGFSGKIFPTVLNEVKKIFLIVLLSFLGLIFSFIPLFIPISVGITILLLATEYIDYSWSRHDIKFRDCRRDLFKNIFGYGVGGAFFMVIISVPLLNIIVPSFATSYFTILWVNNNERGNQAS